MRRHFLLWATGQDRPGIVAGVTQKLFQNNCNIQDSSMMRLGSEFGILLIFSSDSNFSDKKSKEMFARLAKKLQLTIGIKKISPKQALFQRVHGPLFSISVHGSDRPGIVSNVTQLLAHHRFNITDLSTHRTVSGKKPGFILFVEGELPKQNSIRIIERALLQLGKKLQTKITVHPITPSAL